MEEKDIYLRATCVHYEQGQDILLLGLSSSEILYLHIRLSIKVSLLTVRATHTTSPTLTQHNTCCLMKIIMAIFILIMITRTVLILHKNHNSIWCCFCA